MFIFLRSFHFIAWSFHDSAVLLEANIFLPSMSSSVVDASLFVVFRRVQSGYVVARHYQY